MKKRKSLITEETVINIDEDVIKIKSDELICDLFIDYVNGIHGKTVIEPRLEYEK